MKTVAMPGRRLTWASWPSTQIAPSRSTQPAIAVAIWRTGAGAAAEVSRAMAARLGHHADTPTMERMSTDASTSRSRREHGHAPRPEPRRGREGGAARGAARLLRRRRPRGGDRRAGPRPLRRPRLRAQADRAQQARRGRPGDPRRDLRRGDRRGADRCDRRLLRARREPRGAPPGRRARAEDDRRDLPAGHQGPPRGQALRHRRLRHPADRPRGPRGGRGHRRRGARAHPARAEPRRRRQHRGARPQPGGLALPDHAVGRRDPRDGRGDPRALPRAARPAQRRHLLRHPEPAAGGQGDRPRAATC